MFDSDKLFYAYCVGAADDLERLSTEAPVWRDWLRFEQRLPPCRERTCDERA